MKYIFSVILSVLIFFPIHFAGAQATASSYSYSSSNFSSASTSSSTYASGDQSSTSAIACVNGECKASQSVSKNIAVNVSAPLSVSDSEVSASEMSAPQKTSKSKNKPKTAITKTTESTTETGSSKEEENKIPRVTIADSQKTKINVLPSVTIPPKVSSDNIKKLPALENNWNGVGIIALIALILGILVYFGSNFFFKKESVNQQDLFSYKPDENLDSFRASEKDSEVQDSLPPENNKENRW